MTRPFVDALFRTLAVMAIAVAGVAHAQMADDAPRVSSTSTSPADSATSSESLDLPADFPAPDDDESDGAESLDDEEMDGVLEPPDATQRKSLEERLAAIAGTNLSEDDKRQAVELYQQAIKSFDAWNQHIQAAIDFQQQLEKTRVGRQSAAETAARLDGPLLPYADVTGEPLEVVEQRAALVETALAGYRDDLTAMIAEPKRRAGRMAELPKQLAEAQQKLKGATEELSALDGGDPSDVLTAARQAALTYRVGELKATHHALGCEQQLYEQSADWVTLRRDYFARYVPHKEKRLAQLREIIKRMRDEETQQQARLAAATAAEAVEVKRPKQIIELANRNKQLADERTTIVDAMTKVTQDYDATLAVFTQLDSQYKSAQQRAEKLSSAGGQLLREQQSKLPNLRNLQRDYADREPRLSEVLLRQYALLDESSELANLDELTEHIALEAGDLGADGQSEVRKLLSAKRETLDLLIADYEKYSTDLNSLHSEQARLIDLTLEYADFIAERVLWIRSCAPPARSDLRHAARAAAWSLDPHNWLAAGRALLETGRRRPAAFALLSLGVIALMAGQRPARRQLIELGEEAKKRGCIKLRPTIDALGLTVLAALPWPAALGFLGWTLDSLSEWEFVRSLGIATRYSAVCLLLIELSRQLCRRGGLAEAHFGWPVACLIQLRRKLRWLTMLGTPLVLWLVGLEAQATEPYWSTSLGRALFIAVMLLLATVFHRLLLAAASPFRQIVLVREGWMAPVRVLWRPAAVLLPAALAILAGVGFYYTAQQAAVRILQTVAMVLSVVTLGGVTRRWLLISRRRLAREQAKQRRAQLAAAGDDLTSPPADIVDDAVDLAALSEQTQKLVRAFLALTVVVGLVLIWGEILPALKYPAKHLLPGAETLTWGNLVAFTLILAVTYGAVRDVPALLELVILRHLPLDSGSRYAFTAMSRYLLGAIGLSAAFNAIGGEWAKIQWLVAAMSVGLGFGLQEIFANFVSGIILLFERPIRVGDVITLGDKTGVVNRIRMRATTLVDPDRKEYIVPNKDLVTGRLLNWTLTDYTNRVEIIVNVAAGSDTDVACALLLEAAREQPYILPEPTPSATFEGFSETGLKLALRCFLPNLDNRGSTIHALHTSIDRKLRAAGVEGAYADMRVRLARDAGRSQAEARSHMAFRAQADRQGAA